MEIDVFWSFRSPWSYLATPRLRQWQEQYELTINFRPVYPIAIRTPEFFHQVHPQWRSYFMTDLTRVAEYLGLPLTWPVPDPVGQTRGENGRPQTNAEQPYIHRLTMLGIIAQAQGCGVEFADEVSQLIWSGTKNWHLGEYLNDAASRCGLSLDKMDKQLENQKDRLENEIQSNQKAHGACGHWGVPTFGYKGKAYFGQDRLDVLLWALKRDGLKTK
jgi:2-hydroxychromene-2-carboxylate isomerase